MAIDAGTTDIKALRVGSTVISRAFLGNQKIYDQLDYPTLDLNFALTKTLDPRVTFTRASTATYFDSAGVLRSAAINEPRFDYNPATLVAQGLLIEEQRTNSMLQSEDFDNATWSAKTAVTITTNTTSAPNGTLTADTITENTTTSQHLTGAGVSGGVSSGTTYTFSCFVKQGSGTRKVFLTAFGQGYSVFDPTTGNVVQASGNVCTATNVGNGWWRFSAAITKTNTNAGFFIGLWSTAANYAGDGTSSLICWGAQVEAGAFPTSYIPTTAIALTRAADLAAMTGTNFSSWYNQSEGTVSVAFDVYAPSVPDGYGRVYQIDDGTLNNNIALLKNNGFGSVYYGYVGVANVVQVTLFTPAILANIPVKVATAYKLNDFAQSTNGESVTTDTSGTIPTVTQMRIGSTSGSAAMNGHIRRITYFNRRLANSELQLLSS